MIRLATTTIATVMISITMAMAMMMMIGMTAGRPAKATMGVEPNYSSIIFEYLLRKIWE